MKLPLPGVNQQQEYPHESEAVALDVEYVKEKPAGPDCFERPENPQCEKE